MLKRRLHLLGPPESCFSGRVLDRITTQCDLEVPSGMLRWGLNDESFPVSHFPFSFTRFPHFDEELAETLPCFLQQPFRYVQQLVKVRSPVFWKLTSLFGFFRRFPKSDITAKFCLDEIHWSCFGFGLQEFLRICAGWRDYLVYVTPLWKLGTAHLK